MQEYTPILVLEREMVMLVVLLPKKHSVCVYGALIVKNKVKQVHQVGKLWMGQKNQRQENFSGSVKLVITT